MIVCVDGTSCVCVLCGCCWLWLSGIGLCCALAVAGGSRGHCCVLLVVVGCCWLLLVCVGWCWLMLGFVGCCGRLLVVVNGC